MSEKSSIDSFFDGMDTFLDSADRILPATQPEDGEDEPNEPITRNRGASGLVVSGPRYLLAGARAPWHIVRSSDNLVLLSGMDRDVVNGVCQMMNKHYRG